MHSLKNTFIAVLLLGVSYFVYDGITNPDPRLQNAEPGEGIDIEMPDTSNQFTDDSGTSRHDVSGTGSQFARLDKPAVEDFRKSFGATTPSTAPPSSTPPKRHGMTNQPPSTQFNPRQPGSGSFQPTPPSSIAENSSTPPQPKSFGGNSMTSDNGSFQPEMAPVNPRPSNSSFNPSVSREAQTPPATMSSLPEPALTENDLIAVWPRINGFVEDGSFRRALAILSKYYEAVGVSADQRSKLLDWLDALAGKVIYSSEHNLFPEPYIVRTEDTLDSIAQQWQVPAQLVYNINQAKIADPTDLLPGNELKKVQGPFDAEFDVSDQTLTLFLNNLYAGRFEAQVGNMPAEGTYRVNGKSKQGNQLGPFVISLKETTTGNECYFHAAMGQGGSLGLDMRDAEDLFGILAEGSEITIKR